MLICYKILIIIKMNLKFISDKGLNLPKEINED